MRLLVQGIRQVTEAVKSFTLVNERGGDLPEYEPGSHLTLSLQTGPRVLIRHYSIMSDPHERDRYVIGVRRESSGGGGSVFLHDTVREGDVLECSGPHAGMTLHRGAPHSILIAGGIGITPMLSMLHALVADGASCELHYASRRSDACAFAQEVTTIGGARVRFYFSDQKQRLDARRILDQVQTRSHVYVCGPRGLILAVRAAATEHGFEPGQIHFEHFGPPRHNDDEPIELTLARSGRTIHVEPGVTLLDAMLDAGVFAPYECRRGECGTCLATVLEGEVDHRDLQPDGPHRAGSICTCVSWARGGRLTLDL